MNSSEFDRRFDDGESVVDALDLAQAFGNRFGLEAAAVGQVQPWCPARQNLARCGRAAMAHHDHQCRFVALCACHNG